MDSLDMPQGVREVMQKFFSPEFDVCLEDIEMYVNTLNRVKDSVEEEDFVQLMSSLLRMADGNNSARNLREALENDEVISALEPSLAKSLLDMMEDFCSHSMHPLRALPTKKQSRCLPELSATSSRFPSTTESLSGKGKSQHMECHGDMTGKRQPKVTNVRLNQDGTWHHRGESPDSLSSTGQAIHRSSAFLHSNYTLSAGVRDNVSTKNKENSPPKPSSCDPTEDKMVCNLATVPNSKSGGIQQPSSSVIRNSKNERSDNMGSRGNMTIKSPGRNCIIVGVKAAGTRNRFILPKPSDTDVHGATGEETELNAAAPKKRGRLPNKGRIDVVALCGAGKKRGGAKEAVKRRKKTSKKKEHGKKKSNIPPKAGEEVSVGMADAGTVEKILNSPGDDGKDGESHGLCLERTECSEERWCDNDLVIDEVVSDGMSIEHTDIQAGTKETFMTPRDGNDPGSCQEPTTCPKEMRCVTPDGDEDDILIVDDDSSVNAMPHDSSGGGLPGDSGWAMGGSTRTASETSLLLGVGSTEDGHCLPTCAGGEDMVTYVVDDSSCCCEDCWKEEEVD